MKQPDHMLALLRCDFKQYLRHNGYDPDRSVKIHKRIFVIMKSPGLWAAAVQRLDFFIRRRSAFGGRHPAALFLKSIYFILNQIVMLITKIQIEKGLEIGPGLFLSNRGEIVMGARSIGANCHISRKVSIGIGGLHRKKPLIGNNVFIGASSVVFGDIAIGDNVVIKANAVCSKTIPANAVVSGNPACIIVRCRAGRETPFRDASLTATVQQR